MQLFLAGFDYAELQTVPGLKRLDGQFLDYLRQQDALLVPRLLAYRQRSSCLTPLQTSELLLECAPWLERFLAQLFDIEEAVTAQQARVLVDQPLFVFKEQMVQKRAKRRLMHSSDYPPFVQLDQQVNQLVQRFDLAQEDPEWSIACLTQRLLVEWEQYAGELELVTQWCVQALATEAGRQAVLAWVSFRLPRKRDYQQLVPVERLKGDDIGYRQGLSSLFRQRDGFDLTDPRMSPREVLSEVHYCVYCHTNDGDFCSKGFPVKKTQPELGFKKDPLGEILTGCPLEEKISEMNWLQSQGNTLAALAVIMIDNPMCPITGHRICNDCMKACIYQKQDPVDIPQIETRILTDVLALPWGVELYDLLTRWNPLRNEQYLPEPYQGHKVLIVGMGPAGFSMAHHLTMAGFAVVAVDGLKIEPLAQNLIQQPIKYFSDITEKISERVTVGFGGVTEYGITSRWDKNFLKLIYLSLLRRAHFNVFGNVRFGGTLTVEDVWALGFDHLVLAVGAGLPQALAIPGSMAPGMRQAADFLMALQLTGAAKKSSLANLQIRLPAVVIGGGLTGIDTATELQAYYLVQITKLLERYEQVTTAFGVALVRQRFDAVNLAILDEFLHHGHLLRKERALAAQQQREPSLINLLRSWGGVTIVYRRTINESPAYRSNPEEVAKALEEGIYYLEEHEPSSVRLDQHGHVCALVTKRCTTHAELILPARAILVATGAKPNIAYEFEHRGTFHRLGEAYQSNELIADQLKPLTELVHCKQPQIGPFTSYQQQEDKRVTFIGDVHPLFQGSVVKAVASAKRSYPAIVKVVAQKQAVNRWDYAQFARKMQKYFTATVIELTRLASDVIEIIIKAPLAARNYQPGHFYRLQNYASHARMLGDTPLQTEAMALLPAKVDKIAGTISLIVVEQEVSTRLVATFGVGDPVALMGPTGVRTKIPQNKETILVIGGRLAAVKLLSLSPSLRLAGNRVVFLGCFTDPTQVFYQEKIEQAADQVIWCFENTLQDFVALARDLLFQGEVISALSYYAQQQAAAIPLIAVNRILVCGDYPLLHALQQAGSSVLARYFTAQLPIIVSVFGPMQCMLKGVCAQCLQWQIDPNTGERTKAVFSCSWQDQPLPFVDIANLQERTQQNKMQEILSNLWLDYLFASRRFYDVLGDKQSSGEVKDGNSKR